MGERRRGLPRDPLRRAARRLTTFRGPCCGTAVGRHRDALEFGPPVPQATRAGSVMSSVSGSTADGSADCLTLNVWSHELGAAGLPVMVWIHGGKYLEGTSASPHQDGANLARSGVVMISMNYRVGVEGFAHIAGASPHLVHAPIRHPGPTDLNNRHET
jgi:carboxylesterase type B